MAHPFSRASFSAFMASDKNDNSEAAKAEIQRLKKNVSTKKGQNTRAHNAVAKAQANLDNYDTGEFENINKANKRLNEINESLKKAKENLAAIKQQDIGAARFEDLKKNLESMKDIDWSSFGVDFSKIQSLEDFNRVLKSIKDSSGKGAEEAIEAINRALQSALGSAGKYQLFRGFLLRVQPLKNDLIAVAAVVQRTLYAGNRGGRRAGLGDDIRVNLLFAEHLGDLNPLRKRLQFRHRAEVLKKVVAFFHRFQLQNGRK